jgi:glycogen debranching enzyme
MTSTILRSGTLLLSEDTGDVEAGGASGLYVADTRLLSSWVLQVNGSRLMRSGGAEESSDRTVALMLPGRRHKPSPVLVLRRQVVTANGLAETWTVRNASRLPVTAMVSLQLAVDFADQFAVRSDGRTFDLSAAERSSELTPEGAVFAYRHTVGDRVFAAAAHVVAAPPADACALGSDGNDLAAPLTLTWELQLPAQGQTDVRLTVGPASDPDTSRSTALSSRLLSRSPDLPPRSPSLRSAATTDAAPAMVRHRSLADLQALLMPSPEDSTQVVPGAGAPWFLTLFGRDSLLTAELVADHDPALPAEVLRALARTQGTRYDPTTLEQPGLIVHELRSSELATLGLVPYARYYGSVDVTPLFLAVLGRASLRSGGEQLAMDLEQAARAAIDWVRGPGGLDEHGFVRFTPDPGGLANQGWKDSEDSTCYADGSLATGALALCEVQGYAWEGLTAAAGLARGVWGDPGLASELEQVAVELRERFLDVFWLPGQDFPALAVTADGTAVDGLGSNAGHLLWSGILPQDRAEAVVRRLLSPDFFTGWGLRTLASGQGRYSPLAYHNGSVWPHDTMLAVHGMARHGFEAEADVVAAGLVAAGAHLEGRLPEFFAGFSAEEVPFPVPMDLAGSPQAWAAAAGLAATDRAHEVR